MCEATKTYIYSVQAKSFDTDEEERVEDCEENKTQSDQTKIIKTAAEILLYRRTR